MSRNLSHLSKFIALLFVGALLLVSASTAFGQTNSAVTFQRVVAPNVLPYGQGEFTVTLTVSGNSAGCGTQVARKPLDIVLVIDRSSSMGNLLGFLGGKSKLDSAKEAAKVFLSKVNLGNDKVALVQFNEAANLAQPLDTNRQTLDKAIDGLVSSGNTSLDRGVDVARQELKSARRRSNTNGVIILLSDGESDETSARNAADAAKRDGLRVITIGLGSGANQNLLRSLASQSSDYYYSPDTNNLTSIYEKIAESVKQFVAATDLTLKHTIEVSAFQIVPNSISPAPATISVDTITWKLDSLGDTQQTFTYKLKPIAQGNLLIDRGDTLTFTQCEKAPSTISEKPGLPVQVLAPTATATRPPTSTRTATPLPTPTPTFNEMVQQTTCDYGTSLPPWLLCLVPLLMLFFIVYFLRIVRELQEKRKPCPLIWWLLLPLAFILLCLILNQLLNAACVGGESVYFWKIDSFGGSGIYVSSRDGVRPALPFREVNSSSGCVACHAVSSTTHRIAAISGGGVGPVVVYGLDGKRIDIPGVTGSFLNWSPDGTKLAISTDRRQIVIMDADGGTITPLAGASESNVAQLMPAWSPDGTTIAFVRSNDPSGTYRADSASDIYTVPATGGVAKPLPGASGRGFNYYPAYSPDGRWIAFTHHISGTTTYSDPYAEIYMIPAEGGTPIRLAANDTQDGRRLTGISNSWPTWSRDGQTLAFNSKRNGNQYDIFTTRINPDGTSGPAMLLSSAADGRAFEHLPFWGEPPKMDPWAGVLGLWPCLIPFLLIPILYLLCWYFTRRRIDIIEVDATPVRPRPGPLPPLVLNPTWQVAPALIIGVGGTGRWVLTHLKKSLLDGGIGKLPPGVRFVLLDTSEEETNTLMDANGKPQAVEFAGVRLEPSEMLLLQDSLENVVRTMRANPNVEPALQGWLPTERYAQLPAGQVNLAEGTRGRRPMARAGLIKKMLGEAERQTGSTTDAKQIWNLLANGARDALDGRQTRVIVIGSLAGGMSGTLFDLAHLARLAGQQTIPAGGTVTVEGYLATAGVFNQTPGNSSQRQINTFAAMRELQRFQLAQGRAYPMAYRANAKLPLDSVCDRQLFDDLFFFGTGGLAESGQDKDTQPWATTFAAMADIIAFRLDRGTGAGGEGDYRRQIQAQGAIYQQQRNAAFIGGAGSFVYRLPMKDIVDQIKLRWARQLLHEFIQGTNVPKQPGTPAPNAAEDAARFLQGDYGCGTLPGGMNVIESLCLGSRPSVDRADLNRLPEPDSVANSFRTYLQHALKLILNGAKASKTVPVGRVRFALQFLDQVAHYLAQAEKVAGEAQESARSQESAAAYERARKMAAQWHAETQLASNSLRKQRELLEGAAGAPGKPPLIGVYQRVADLETQARHRRAQMDRVAVREYLWWRVRDVTQSLDDPNNRIDLADEWYHLAADKHIQEYHERFYWEFSPEGAPCLSLVTFEGNAMTLVPETSEKFVQEVLRLGNHVVREMWETVTLADIMSGRQMIADQEQSAHTTARMWVTAMPHLLSRQKTNIWNAAFGIPQIARARAQELVNVFANLGGVQQQIPGSLNPCPTSIVPLTDQYATVLIRTLDLVAVADVPEMDDARRVYEQSMRTTVAGAEGAEMQTVFAAERNALTFERRLPDPNIFRLPIRQFHPLVVMALENQPRVRLFGLAFAAGWVRVPAQDGAITLHVPVGATYTLAEKKAEVTLAPEVATLYNFCQHGESAAIDAIRAATDQPDEATIQAWQEYYAQWHDWQGAPPLANQPRELQDLGALAGLVVFDKLKAYFGQ